MKHNADFDAARVGLDLVVEWERAELAARWFQRGSAPTAEHYAAVMSAITASELADGDRATRGESSASTRGRPATEAPSPAIYR